MNCLYQCFPCFRRSEPTKTGHGLGSSREIERPSSPEDTETASRTQSKCRPFSEKVRLFFHNLWGHKKLLLTGVALVIAGVVLLKLTALCIALGGTAPVVPYLAELTITNVASGATMIGVAVAYALDETRKADAPASKADANRKGYSMEGYNERGMYGNCGKKRN